MSLMLYLSILLLLYCIYELHRHRQHTQLYHLVSWSVTTYYGSDPLFRPSLDLIDYVRRAQHNLGVPADYCFSGQDDLDAVDLLLKEYQRFLSQSYFNSSLQLPKFKKKLTGEQYFMYMLCRMLQEHQCDSRYLDRDMHIKRLSYTKHGSWGAVHYDAEYLLSDFALTYHKLYYIAYLYCCNDPLLNHNNGYCAADSIKEIIDTKQLSVWRY